jgi:hypothetical protein
LGDEDLFSANSPTDSTVTAFSTASSSRLLGLKVALQNVDFVKSTMCVIS